MFIYNIEIKNRKMDDEKEKKIVGKGRRHKRLQLNRYDGVIFISISSWFIVINIYNIE